MSSVGVIGAGISGLATAALLARDGHEVTVFEAGQRVGGRAGLWEAGGFRFDTGPSWYLMPEVFEHFFRLMGTSAERELEPRRLEPGYRVFFEGHADPMDIHSDRERSIAQFEAVEPGAGAALARHLDSADASYELAMRHFLYNDFSRPTTLLAPPVLRRPGMLARLLLESLHDRLARTFRDPRLRQILGYPAVFLGASPRTAPSLYHLMSRFDLADGVFYPRGGFSELIDRVARLAERAGAAIRTAAPVERIVVEGGRAAGLAVREGGALVQRRFDLVVSTVDAHHSDTELLPARFREHPERHWTTAQPGPGAVLAMLGVRGRLPRLRHHTLVFTADWDRNFGAVFGARPAVPEPASFYACMPSASDPHVAPAGHENLFLLIPVPADVGIGFGGVDGAGDPAVEAAADRAIAELARRSGVPDLAARIVVRRTVGPADFERDFHSWRGSALGPGHTLRQSAFLRGRIRSRNVAGLFYAGATTIPGIGLPMCLISAELVAKAVRGDRSSAPLPEPQPEPQSGSEPGLEPQARSEPAVGQA
jgi:1-hydroxy-2-isopentenylcarotenoid 3,4-desaturase